MLIDISRGYRDCHEELKRRIAAGESKEKLLTEVRLMRPYVDGDIEMDTYLDLIDALTGCGPIHERL